jgi:ABC-type Mn2+/Zn2+ transport system ATPase subunit
MTSALIKASQFKLYSPAKRLLQTLSFDLHGGQILCLKGVNGSGKSTFLKQLFLALSESRTRSPGLELRSSLRFAYLPQSLNREFFVPLSLKEVATLANSGGQLSSEHQELLPESLQRTLWNLASGGERQRSVLAQTLGKPYDLYLLDEPFNHLDQDSIRVTARIIERLALSGSAFLMATHVVPTEFGTASIKVLPFDSQAKSQQELVQ